MFATIRIPFRNPGPPLSLSKRQSKQAGSSEPSDLFFESQSISLGFPLPSAVLLQEADCAFQLLGEAVDLFGGGDEAEAGLGGAGQLVMAVQGLGAVVAAADAHSRRIQQGGLTLLR
jgi:hypothetical protein